MEKKEKERNDLLELDSSDFKVKEVMIIFKDKERESLRIVDPKEAYNIKDFFKYVTKENFEHRIHIDIISEIKIHR